MRYNQNQIVEILVFLIQVVRVRFLLKPFTNVSKLQKLWQVPAVSTEGFVYAVSRVLKAFYDVNIVKRFSSMFEISTFEPKFLDAVLTSVLKLDIPVEDRLRLVRRFTHGYYRMFTMVLKDVHHEFHSLYKTFQMTCYEAFEDLLRVFGFRLAESGSRYLVYKDVGGVSIFVDARVVRRWLCSDQRRCRPVPKFYRVPEEFDEDGSLFMLLLDRLRVVDVLKQELSLFEDELARRVSDVFAARQFLDRVEVLVYACGYRGSHVRSEWKLLRPVLESLINDVPAEDVESLYASVLLPVGLSVLKDARRCLKALNKDVYTFGLHVVDQLLHEVKNDGLKVETFDDRVCVSFDDPVLERRLSFVMHVDDHRSLVAGDVYAPVPSVHREVV